MNKVVLITGGSRGIGAECVRKFAQNNYDVIFTYLNSEEKAKKIAEENSAFSNVIAYRCDVANHSEMQKLGEFIKSTFGKVDALISNAGIAQIAPIIDVSESNFDKIVNTNLKGAYNAVKAVLPFMLDVKKGKIVFVSSVWGMVGASCESVYSATKSALNGFMKSLAKELGPSHINVNSVAPGIISTDMNAELSSEDIKQIVNEIPLGKVGRVEDVANAIYFLCSDEADYISGDVLKVDGGWISGWR